MARGVLAFFAVAALLVAGAHGAGDFVTITGNRFTTASCQDFAFGGYNSWQVIESAGNVCCGGLVNLQAQLDAAADANFAVVRMFGFSVQQGINNQITPSEDPTKVVYNESMLVAFDHAIAELSSRNLKAIVALANNWDYNGNMSDAKAWYTNKTVGAKNPDDFFINPTSINYYLANAQNIMTRMNTVTKIAYNQDPTIMAWDLMNEARCEYAGCVAANIYSWFAKVAPAVKKNAPMQLVTTGIDGFYQASNCASNTINPVPNSNGWPLQTGQDFLPDHQVSGIDYASVHLWPDNWDRTDLDFGKSWINNHRLQAQSYLKMPLVIEEFGKGVGGASAVGQTIEQQTAYYNVTYAITEASINAGQALRGVLFWRWDAVDNTARLTGFDQEATLASDSQAYTVTILPFTRRMAQRCPSAAPHRAGTATSAASTAGRRLLQNSPSNTVITAPAPQVVTTPNTPSTNMAAATPQTAQSVVPTTGVASTTVNAQATGAACQADTSVGSIAGK